MKPMRTKILFGPPPPLNQKHRGQMRRLQRGPSGSELSGLLHTCHHCPLDPSLRSSQSPSTPPPPVQGRIAAGVTNRTGTRNTHGKPAPCGIMGHRFYCMATPGSVEPLPPPISRC